VGDKEGRSRTKRRREQGDDDRGQNGTQKHALEKINESKRANEYEQTNHFSVVSALILDI
jgi:hypothetical protein